jgi:uncharacterized protein (DUF1697 family)
MEKIKYIALLRGINVGGKSIIKMNELKTVFEKLKFSEIKTYIQSGNIIFSDTEKDKTKLTKIIQKALFEKFNYDCPTIIYNINEYQNIINNIPNGFGTEKEKYKYDVWFLINQLFAFAPNPKNSLPMLLPSLFGIFKQSIKMNINNP